MKEALPPEESPYTKLKKEIESDPKLPLKVPKRLFDPDWIITSAKRYFDGMTPSVYDRYPGILRPGNNEVNIGVTPKNLNRALRIMDTFIKLIKVRNHQIEIRHDQTIVIIYGIELQISLKERFKIIKVPEAQGKWYSNKYEPTGLLSFRLEGIYKKEWIDGKDPLESKLAAILAKLETHATWKKEMREYHDEQNRVRQEKQKALQGTEERKAEELKRYEGLLLAANRWNQSKILRGYIDHIKNQDNGSPEDLIVWVRWANNKADWLDPTINKEDELLGTYNLKSG